MSLADFYKKDEIDLADYLRILIRRKNTIFSVLLVYFGLIIVILVSVPNRYEACAVVRIGGFSAPLFSATGVLYELQSVDYLKEAIKILELDESAFELRDMIEVGALTDANLIKIKTKAFSPKLAAKFCNWLVDTFVVHGNEIYNKEAGIFNERIEKLEAGRFIGDQQKIFLIKKELVESKDFKVLSPAVVPRRAVISKERADAIFLISVAAFMLSILLVSFQEFWAKNR